MTVKNKPTGYVKTPEFKSIPVDRQMAEVIMTALSVAEHESQIVVDGKDTPAKRLVRVLRAVYPEAVKPHDGLDWVKNA